MHNTKYTSKESLEIQRCLQRFQKSIPGYEDTLSSAKLLDSSFTLEGDGWLTLEPQSLSKYVFVPPSAPKPKFKLDDFVEISIEGEEDEENEIVTAIVGRIDIHYTNPVSYTYKLWDVNGEKYFASESNITLSSKEKYMSYQWVFDIDDADDDDELSCE